jgi:hypothetical protein
MAKPLEELPQSPEMTTEEWQGALGQAINGVQVSLGVLPENVIFHLVAMVEDVGEDGHATIGVTAAMAQNSPEAHEELLVSVEHTVQQLLATVRARIASGS